MQYFDGSNTFIITVIRFELVSLENLSKILLRISRILTESLVERCN